ncbi:MAG: RtcB family protein [Thermoplasmata archaeon]|nr:RtcB family protein [Thermoplasmata archaeon]
MGWNGPLNKIDEFRYEIPQSYKSCMRTSAIIFTDEKMIENIRKDNAAEQVANVACMKGIVGKSLAMPDIHWGYGFPIGGVAAFDAKEGVISPGGIGFDINCGVRLVRTDLRFEELKDKISPLIDTVFRNVPSGVGESGKLRLTSAEMDEVLLKGAKWAVEKGYGWTDDLTCSEENGSMAGANPDNVSQKAKHRGSSQLGTLGGGNHFLEIQKVDKIFDEKAAKTFGILSEDQIMVSIHTGSRGCGHQIATDYLRVMEKSIKDYDIQVEDRQLACAPVDSREGQDYFSAMVCAANYAWANRQLILHWTRESFERTLGVRAQDIGMKMIYDVAHNICKIETHSTDSGPRKLYVHRKGATRAFAANAPGIPDAYSSIGQPVLIPGDMGSASYVLIGTERAMQETFGSTCHGAGRLLSRMAATRRFEKNRVIQQLRDKGIYVRAASKEGIIEEAPGAYKNVDDVVRIADGAGISRVVARLVPIGVMKG